MLFFHKEAGHAILSIYANDPDLLKNEPADLVTAIQQATGRAVRRGWRSRALCGWRVRQAIPSCRFTSSQTVTGR